MKNIKVLLDDKFLGTTPIDPVNTISNLKEYGKTVVKHYNMNPDDYVTDIYLDSKNKLDLTQISDDLVLGPHLHLFTDPHLHVHRNIQRTLTGIKDVDLKILSSLEDRDILSFCAVDKYSNTLCEESLKRRFYEKYVNLANLRI